VSERFHPDGDRIPEAVVPFQVYDLTRSTLAVGLLGHCTLIPVFVFPIVEGAVADAVERRRLVVISHAFLAVLSLLLAANALLPQPELWPLYVFATLSAAVGTFNRPALSTWPARLLDPDLLPSANALESGIGSLDYMVAPVVAGVLIAVIEPAGAFLFGVATFLVVIATVRTIQSVFLADLNAMVFAFPLALFPAVAADRLDGGPVLLGVLYGAIAAGSLVASVFSGRAKHVRRQGRAIMVAVAVWGAAIVVFGLSTAAWLSVAMLAIAGAGDMVSAIFRQTILQAAVQDRFRGRLDGIGMAVWATGPSLGDLESGVVASVWSVPGSIVSGGIGTVLGIGLLRWFAPGFWHYDARDPTPRSAMLAFDVHVYDTLKLIHILAAVIWVGTGLYFQVAGTRLRRAGTPEQVAAFAGNVAAAAPLMVASSITVLAAGIALVLYAPGLDFTDTWIWLGLLGYAATFVTGMFVIRPRADHLAEVMTSEGPTSAAAQALIGQLFAISRIDAVVLVLVIAVMVFKPGA
jgi:MFS family permease